MKTRRKYYQDEVPEEVRQHVQAAREEMRESIRAFLPPGFVEHRKKARKEMLLAWRSLIDSAIERMDKTKDEETLV
ncbi:MAG TPA: hypothetical protein VK909_21660 [Anaerolineales bacterium]|nr:hypothetical protein [Anaerolineales bacterium]